MKQLLFLLITISSFAFAQEKYNDSLFQKYKPYFDKFSEIDPSINELETKRNKLNETLGVLVLEKDSNKRNALIKKNIGKDQQSKLLKMSTSEIENMRIDLDNAMKVNIELNCLKVEQQYNEFLIQDMQKSRANYLINNGYNLEEFNKLSDEDKKKILKDWKYKTE